MLARAKELNIQLPDSELDTAYNEGRKNVPDEAFNKELSARNLSASDMRDSMRRDMLAQKVLEREVTSKIAVSDQEITDFYNANKAQFNLPEDAYRLAQIVITGQKDQQIANRTGNDATTPQEAQQKVQMLMERLKSGTPFQELAMDFSEDPESAPRGGDVGLVPVSSLNQAPKALRDAVMKMQPGSVSVVPMPGGFTVVALAEKQTKGQRDLNTPGVKDAIAGNIKSRREQLLRAAYLETTRNRAAIVNHLARRIVDGQGAVPPSLALSRPK
jgi:peptidyl-prolyl cis-trans isomerase SurA